MRSVDLSLSFLLRVQKNNPGVLKLNTDGGRSEVNLVEFLKILPLHFNSRFNYHSGATMSGETWSDRGFLGFVTDNKENPLKFLRHFSYSHYTNLASDLEKLNPNYHFTKKSGQTLSDYHLNYADAISGMSVDEILPKVTKMKDIISFNNFSKYFTCINKDTSQYTISHYDVKHVEPLYEVFKDKIEPFPSYSLVHDTREILLYVIDEQFYLVKNDGEISYATFKKNEIMNVANEINAFFPINPGKRASAYYNPHSIIVQSIDKSAWSKTIKTTAKKVVYENKLADNFSVFRNFFSEKYKIKARGKDQLWERGINSLKNSKPLIDYPLFSSMCSVTYNLEETDRNTHITNIFKEGSKLDKLDLFVKLSLMQENDIIENTNEVSPHYGVLTERPLSGYIMPDFGEEAKNVKSFKDIIDN